MKNIRKIIVTAADWTADIRENPLRFDLSDIANKTVLRHSIFCKNV